MEHLQLNERYEMGDGRDEGSGWELNDNTCSSTIKPMLVTDAPLRITSIKYSQYHSNGGVISTLKKDTFE